MFKYLIIGLLLFGCASPKVCLEGEYGERFYTNVGGPSEASGDCGGQAFWLKLENDKVVSAEYAAFEGGCKVFRQAIKKVEHDLVTGELFLEGPFFKNGDRFRFKGKLTKKSMKGRIGFSSTIKNQGVKWNYTRDEREYAISDFEALKRKLGEN